MVTGGSVFVEAVEVAHTTGPMSRLSAAGTALKRGNIERLSRGEYAPLRLVPAEGHKLPMGKLPELQCMLVVTCHNCHCLEASHCEIERPERY